MWLFQADKGTLDQKLMTLATTIILLQQMEILPSQLDTHDRTKPKKTLKLFLKKIYLYNFFRGLSQKWMVSSGQYKRELYLIQL